jgi:hypothetical protein
MAAALIILAIQKTNGGRVSVFDDGGALIFVFAAVTFVVSSICFLIAALDQVRHRQDEPLPAQRSLKSAVLPIFCLVVSIGLLGFVVTNASRENERNHETALIQARLDNLKVRMDGSLIRSRQESLKARAAANGARMSELIARLNNPTVKCETATATDDPGRLENIQVCREGDRGHPTGQRGVPEGG